MIKPLGKNVLLQKNKTTNEVQVNGIFLKETTNNKNNLATVVAISNSLKTTQTTTEFNENDTVLYKEYAGTTFEYNDIEYVLIEDEAILAVIK